MIERNSGGWDPRRLDNLCGVGAQEGTPWWFDSTHTNS